MSAICFLSRSSHSSIFAVILSLQTLVPLCLGLDKTSTPVASLVTTSPPLTAPSEKAISYQNVSSPMNCWDSWNAYWNTSAALGDFYTTVLTRNITTTIISTYLTTSVSTVPGASWSSPVTLWGPNSDFPIGTYTTLKTASDYASLSIYATSTGPPSVQVTLATYEANVYYSSGYLTTPQCILPSIVPACQSQWDTWASLATPNGAASQPVCQAASLNSSFCERVIKAEKTYERLFGYSGVNGWVTNGTSTWWPSTETIAPGCTLGCQDCAITGNTVQVYYWPSATATAVPNGTAVSLASVLTTAPPTATLTGRGTVISALNATTTAGLVTAVVDNVTLTSPTVYISYKLLYASNSCSGVGPNISNTIIPLAKSSDLSSLAYHELDYYPMMPGRSGSGVSWEYVAVPFNFSDLIEPIPMSVYDQLPWCQSGLAAYTRAGFNAANYTCMTGGPYAPLIAVPTEVLNLDPAWATCTGWYGGLYDPPKALQGVTVAATATMPFSTQTGSASAGSTADPGVPLQTSTSITSGSISGGIGASDPGVPYPSATGSSQSSSSATFQQSDGDPTASGSVLSTKSINTQPAAAASTAAIPEDPAGSSSHASMNAMSVLAAAMSSFSISQNDPISTKAMSSQTQDALSDSYSSAQASHAASSAISLPLLPMTATINAGGEIYTMSQQGSSNAATVLVGDEGTLTLQVGNTQTLGSQTIALLQSGNIAIGSQTFSFSASTGAVAAPTYTSRNIQSQTMAVSQTLPSGRVITLSNTIVTANSIPGTSGAVDLGGIILSVGGFAETLGGQVVSEGSSGLVVDGTVLSLPSVTQLLSTIASTAVSTQSNLLSVASGTMLSSASARPTALPSVASGGTSIGTGTSLGSPGQTSLSLMTTLPSHAASGAGGRLVIEKGGFFLSLVVSLSVLCVA